MRPVVRTPTNTSGTTAKWNSKEYKERIETWKKKSWHEFCKLVMDTDTRYTLMPLVDYNKRHSNDSMIQRLQNADGVFSNFCLTRTGEKSDIYILPSDPHLGILIDAGSKYSRMTLNSYPSKALVWPVLRIADELERQYIREVTIETEMQSKRKK